MQFVETLVDHTTALPQTVMIKPKNDIDVSGNIAKNRDGRSDLKIFFTALLVDFCAFCLKETM